MATIRVHISEDNVPVSHNKKAMRHGDKVLVVPYDERGRVSGEYIAVSSPSCNGCIIYELYNCRDLVHCGKCKIISPEDVLEEL